MNNRLKGTGVAIVTPFCEDETIDFLGLAELVEHLIIGGVAYIVVQGTTGESATTTVAEKQQLLDFIFEKTAGRVPLVMGIGGNNTKAVVESFKNFDANKFEAILSVSPYYNKPTQEGIYQHYKYLAENTPKPIILYNVPGRTNSNMEAATTLRLAHDFDQIIGIKEASGDLNQIGKIIKGRPSGFLVISGDDPINVPIISIGGDGIISVVANAFPKEYTKKVNLALDGNFKEAQKIQLNFIKITELMFKEGNPAGVKAVLEILGVCEENVRLPLVKMSEKGCHELLEAMEKANCMVEIK